MTFSICVRRETDEGVVFGAGAATDAPAVGALTPYVAEDGVICTQSFVNVRVGRRGVEFLSDLAVDDAVDGREAGGDKRGHTSAAVAVWAPQTAASHDLRVDHHETPIEELRGVYERTKAGSTDFSEDTKSRVFD